MKTFTAEQLKNKALEASPGTTNKCNNLEMKLLKLAVWSHQAVSSTMFARLTDDMFYNHYWGMYGNEYAELNSVEQDMLYVQIETPYGIDMAGLFFEHSDLVVICYDSDNLEYHCTMTKQGFFQFLETLPNANRFAVPNKPFTNGTPEGLFLLSKLATDYYAFTSSPQTLN